MCSRSVAKMVLIIFNIVFVILGGVCLGLGIFVYVKRDDFAGVLSRVPLGDEDAKDAINDPSLLERASIGLMVGGGFIFLLGFFGCCGAMKEWRIFLGIYIVIVSLILLLQIAAGVVAIFFRDDVEEKLLDFLKETIDDEYQSGIRIEGSSLKIATEPIELGWDLSQFSFECCGASNYTDWDTASKFERTYTGTYNGQTVTISNAKVPLSCCKISNPDAYPDDLESIQFVDINGCLTAPTTVNANIQEGCYESIKDKLLEYSLILIIVGVVIGVMEIIGVIAAIYLCCKVGEKEV